VGTEGVIIGDIKIEKERWRVIGVYVDEGIEVMSKKVERWIDRTRGNRKTLLVRDFNARVGREGGGFEEEDGEKRERKAKDETVNGEGKKLIEWVEENGWGVFNGSMKGDEEGEFTFTGGKGNSTIDYVLGDEEVKEEIEELRIGERIDSDHHPVEVKVKGRKRKRMIGKKERKEWRGVWNEEGRKEFRHKLGEFGGMRNESIERQWRRKE